MEIYGASMRIENTYRKAEKTAVSAKSFGEALKEADAEGRKTDRAVFSPFCENATSTEDMTMEEYKLYIYCKIAKMPKSSSRNYDCMPLITDEGYEAMKNDPEYEKWALEQIRSAVSYGGGCGRNAKTHAYQIIGGTKEECRYESFTSGGDDKKIEEMRREDQRRFRLQQKARADKRARYRRVVMENAIKKKQMENDHIKGIFEDHLYRRKDVCAVMNAGKLFEGLADR